MKDFKKRDRADTCFVFSLFLLHPPPLLTSDPESLHEYEGAQWREQITRLLTRSRGLVWWRIGAVRDSYRDEADGLTSLLAHLAVTDFALCQARYVMERAPELKSDEDFRRKCAAAERTVFYVWSRLGLYNMATAWARRGLATIVAATLSGRDPRPEWHPGTAGLTEFIGSELKVYM